MQSFLTDLVRWAPDLLRGVQYTILLTFASMALALVLGLLLAFARMKPPRSAVNIAAHAFVELIRGTPLILQLFYIFYVFPFFGLRLGNIEAGILGLAINYSAYLSEVFRAGIEAVDKGQWEAANALGMSHRLSMALIILPQAIRIVIPPLGNYFISLFKDTALASTISISELMFSGQLLAAESFKYLQIYSIIFVMYLIVSYPASLGVKWLERRMSLAKHGPKRV